MRQGLLVGEDPRLLKSGAACCRVFRSAANNSNAYYYVNSIANNCIGFCDWSVTIGNKKPPLRRLYRIRGSSVGGFLPAFGVFLLLAIAGFLQ